MTPIRVLAVFCAIPMLFFDTFGARVNQPRVYTQVASVFGPAGITQNLVFKRVRKPVATAVLKIKASYGWTFRSITGPSPSGSVPIDYRNVYQVAGSSVSSACSVSIPYGPGSMPSGFLYPSTFEVPLDPTLLSGRGDLLLPVLVEAYSAYDTSQYTVDQSAAFTSEVVLEYTY